MVCSELNLPGHDFTNNASYIAHWLERLRSDRKEIFRAAADAQRIADYLLALHPAYAEQDAAPGARGAAEDGDTAAGMPDERAATVAEAA